MSRQFVLYNDEEDFITIEIPENKLVEVANNIKHSNKSVTEQVESLKDYIRSLTNFKEFADEQEAFDDLLAEYIRWQIPTTLQRRRLLWILKKD